MSSFNPYLPIEIVQNIG